MNRVDTIDYVIGNPQVEVLWFEEPLFACLDGEDAGVKCCLVQSCCCAGWAHAKAVGWANRELGKTAEQAFYSDLAANALRSVAGAGSGNGRNGFARGLADVLATGQEIKADIQYFTMRRRLINLMFGVWKKDNGQMYLSWSPPSNPCTDCLVQAFCAPCARCQETSSLMKWRKRVTGFPVRYSVTQCGFEELQPGGFWSPSVREIPPSKQLQGDNLLGRNAPTMLPPMPMVALRV